jgi:hypothetical protein
MPWRYTRWLKNHSSGAVGSLERSHSKRLVLLAGGCSFAERMERSELEHDAAATAAKKYTDPG